MRRLLMPAIAAAVLGTVTLLITEGTQVAAQSGTRSSVPSRSSMPRQSGTVPSQRVQQPQTFEQKLWGYLTRQKYRNWAPVPGQSDDFYEGSSPHGAFLKMYLNRTAAGNLKELPNGSMVVKENYGPDRKTLMAITVMYRSKGYNPDAGDWYWVKYNPDGTVAKAPPAMNSMPLMGKPGGCIKCHGEGADGGDFAFMNDA
jgi:hypothetical protein